LDLVHSLYKILTDPGDGCTLASHGVKATPVLPMTGKELRKLPPLKGVEIQGAIGNWSGFIINADVEIRRN